MTQHELRFYKPNERAPLRFKVWRGISYTYNLSKPGPATIRLDASAKSKSIGVGWEIEIFREDQLRYTGKVQSNKKKDGLRTIALTDHIGMLARRKLFQRPVLEREVGDEVIAQLDGLQSMTRVKLNADHHIRKTGTTKAWSWEYNPTSKFIEKMGEFVVDLKGNKRTYYYWIDPTGVVMTGYDNDFGGHPNTLNMRKITIQESIKSSFNKISVIGNPVHIIPYDKDFWTENGAGWSNYLLNGDANFAMVNLNVVGVSPMVGQVYLVFGNNGGLAGSSATISRHLSLTGDGQMNFENLARCDFHFMWNSLDAANDSTTGLFITFNTDSGAVKWDIATNRIDRGDSAFTPLGNLTWHTDFIDFTQDPVSGTRSWLKDTNSFTIVVGVIDDDSTPGTHLPAGYLDGFFMDIGQYEYVASNQDAIDNYGVSELVLFSRNFYSNAECQLDAETLLAAMSEPTLTINGTVDGFADVIPNQALTIYDEEEDTYYTKPTKSITFTVAQTGKETTSITLGDFFKSDNDALAEKFVEINKNYQLLENPYRVN